MTLLRVRRAAQLTLPAEIRRALHVKDGDYLEAKVVKDSVVLKPVSVIDREKAWKNLDALFTRVRRQNRHIREDPAAQEKWIAGEVKRARGKHAR